MKRPVIGILCNTLFYTNALFAHVEKNYVNSSYICSVRKNGGVPLAIPYSPNIDDTKMLIDLCDGLLIPGGGDVDPKLYNEDPHNRLGEIEPEIDAFIFSAISEALIKSLPILGICKGMQILNIYFGGNLYQDLTLRKQESLLHFQHARRDYLLHSIEIKQDSYIYKVLGENAMYINSMHHQCVKDLGKGLLATAWASDGVIESIENIDGSVLGVQWHPEELTSDESPMNRLFANLVLRALK